jgi:Phage protein (N4 Gp49/phage Sf6 gene 66) family
MTKAIIGGIELDLEPPFLTTDDVQDAVESELYFNFPGTPVTICCLRFKNGGYAVGHSMCINPKNFNDQVGRVGAREKAIEAAFPMLAYAVLEAMKPEPIIPSAPYSEPKITAENVGDIRWIDGGADLAEAVQSLSGIEDLADGAISVERVPLGVTEGAIAFADNVLAGVDINAPLEKDA